MNPPNTTLAERIEFAIDKLAKQRKEKVTWTSLALELGFSTAAPTNWKKGKASRDTLEKIAKITEVNFTWLATGAGNPDDITFSSDVDLNHAIPVTRMLPILSWVQAGNWTEVIPVGLDDILGELPAPIGAGKRSFYLQIRGISNAPYFVDGDYVCIDPDYQIDSIQTGEMVVATCHGEATFKALINEPSKRYLKALNKNWQPRIMELDNQCQLVGKYVGLFRGETRFNIND